MASYVTNKLAKHVLKETAGNHFGSEDPYFEYVAATDMNGEKSGKTVKRKRPVPPGLTKQEEKVLKKVTRRAHRLDQCLNICGIKVGWGAVIGIVPGVGDLFDALMALMVVYTCTQAGIPQSLKSRMMINVALDFAIGLVPFLGDIADAFYRCNTRNAALLYKHLQARGAARIKGEHGEQGGPMQRRSSQRSTRQQRSGPHGATQNDHMEISVPSAAEHVKRSVNEQSTQPPQPQHATQKATNGPREPERARVQSQKSLGQGRWYDRFSSRRQAEPDLENGENVGS